MSSAPELAEVRVDEAVDYHGVSDRQRERDREHDERIAEWAAGIRN
jgi:hypothetical protein